MLAAALLLAAARLAGADQAALAGYWYSEDYQPSLRVTVQELTQRRADGTYEDEFRRYENCLLVFRQREAGTWTFDGDRFHTITTSIDGSLAHFEDEYEVRSLSDKEVRYFHPKSGAVFTDTRVKANFRFPDCPTS